jgi:hypothetical protein
MSIDKYLNYMLASRLKGEETNENQVIDQDFQGVIRRLVKWELSL